MALRDHLFRRWAVSAVLAGTIFLAGFPQYAMAAPVEKVVIEEEESVTDLKDGADQVETKDGTNADYGEDAAVSIPADAYEFNGHYYKAYIERITWTDAKAACEALGGHLCTITSQEEQDFIESINDKRLWIGGYRDTSGAKDEWKWVTGEPWDYTNWLEGEPNGSGVNGEDKAAVWPKTWNDMTNNNLGEQTGYICEWGIDKPVNVPEDAYEFNGHYYKVYDESVTWSEAKAACEELGGHL